MMSGVNLTSSDVRMGLFEVVSVLSNVLITDSSLWTFNNVSPTARCILSCVHDPSCSSVFYNNLTGVCIGHSKVYTTASDTTTASGGSVYYAKNSPEGAGVKVLYTYHRDRMPWDDARVECQKDSGDLAAFETPDKFLAFQDYLDNYKTSASVSNTVWVGLRQNTTDDLFYWTSGYVTGSTVTWSPGYPQNSSKECGYTSPFGNYVMRNYLCTYSASFVCETPRV